MRHNTIPDAEPGTEVVGRRSYPANEGGAAAQGFPPSELIPLAEVEDMVRTAVDRAIASEYLPSLLKPDARRAGLDNPALLGFPPTLPIELALGEEPRNEILTAYNITPEGWEKLRTNPVFISALRSAVEAMQREGMSFRVKARLQSEALLETSWKMIHNVNTPSSVKADLIKHTMKVAGLEPKEQPSLVNPLQININLG
jgi:hypothetical protein